MDAIPDNVLREFGHEELIEWRCEKVPALTYGDVLRGRPGGECNARVANVTAEVSATMVEPVDEAAREIVAMGLPLAPGRTRERPVAYDITVTCTEGHDTFLRTQPVGS